MTDRDFLMWIHSRLEHVHGENPLMDYMHKLRAIIAVTPKDRDTPNILETSGLGELQVKLWTVPPPEIPPHPIPYLPPPQP